MKNMSQMQNLQLQKDLLVMESIFKKKEFNKSKTKRKNF